MNRTRSFHARSLKHPIALLLAAGAAWALGAQPKPLSPEAAVKAVLSLDARVEGARWDWLSAQAKAREAELRRLPSFSLTAGYTRISDLSYIIDFNGMSIPMNSMDNSYSLSASLQYPVFAGYRLQESAQLAVLQARGKLIAAEMIKRSLVFETLRAYWESERAVNNAAMLRENLVLAERTLEVTRHLVANGAALQADLLTAEMRHAQADMDLGAAVNLQQRAFMNLASLVLGGQTPESAALKTNPDLPSEQYQPPFLLTGRPGPVPDSRFSTLDETELVRLALSNRPETRSSGLSASAAELGRKIAEAPLYPVLNLTGSFLYANPNPRVAFQTDPGTFTPTWSLGLSLSYDLGGLPANLAAREAQTDAVRKVQADDRRQREAVILDVRTCLLNFLQTRRDYTLVSGMMEQARESERVTQTKVAAGTASDVDLLSARIARLRVEFTIANKLIDQQIAAADLERAAALAVVE